ncbi:MAG: saccharopine dehydrogenase NADP-binding domain-containing protein [Bacteroidetes bacterium]|nr:saccharopine dehydrogenase NADP-binding domain-containing protein [Bacteroidota bacterium]
MKAPEKKYISLFGAGRSATHLINYLASQGIYNNWNINICEVDTELANKSTVGFSNINVIPIDVTDAQKRIDEIKKADLVISMLPAVLHLPLASLCADIGVDMLTASYVTDEIKQLDGAFKAKNKVLLMECGLDPGIDHMSGMRTLDKIRDAGNKLTGFETFTGGLLAPGNMDNPWQYKFTWNPRNVVLAGQCIVKFIQDGKMKYIPYHRLFRRYEMIHIPGYGYFEGYANRDSLKYLEIYKLQGIKTLYRGTLRRPGFCRAWNVFVQLGATDDSYPMQGVQKMTHREFINSFLYYNPEDSVELKLAHYLNINLEAEVMFKLKWLGIFEHTPIGLESGTPAQILEHILKKKWTLNANDKDMIVMWHKFDFINTDGQKKQLQSHMVVEGNNERETAMSMTVGIPLGIAAKLILTGKIITSGVRIPNEKDLYEPILNELESYGIAFTENEVDPLATQTIPLN